MNEGKVHNTQKTKWGNIWKSTTHGYWIVVSRNEFHQKFFHRLVYEDFYGEIPDGYQVHHIDKNKDNNLISNLQLLSDSDHSKIHYKDNTSFNKYAGLKGSDSVKWKDYPRIIKYGKNKGKQRYAIQYNGQTLKISLYIHKLYKWFSQNFKNKYLYCDFRLLAEE